MSQCQESADQPNSHFLQVLVGTMFGAALLGLAEIGLFDASPRIAAVSTLGAMILGPIFLGLFRALVPR